MFSPVTHATPSRPSSPSVSLITATASRPLRRSASWSAGQSTPVAPRATVRAPTLAALRAPTVVNQLATDCSNERAARIFDSLPPVRSEALVGTWRGAEVSQDHPLSGLLPAFGWYGKRFESDESVHPLVFNAVGGGTFAVNPGWVPMSIGAYVPRWNIGKWLMSALRPIVSTNKPQARLRQVEYRGVVSAAMVYDQLPIIDAFRQIDADTLLGAMDYREHQQPFYFLLRRDSRVGVEDARIA